MDIKKNWYATFWLKCDDELDSEIFNHFNNYNTPIVTFEVIGNIYETKGIFKRIKDKRTNFKGE